MNIKITSTDAKHQYDESGNAITTWHDKKCAWIVNKEYENDVIDWWGKDNDFPRGCTLEEFEKENPNWDIIPDISVSWSWKDKASCVATFGLPHTFGCKSDYWDNMNYPYRHSRNWGYLEYNKEQAIQQLGKFCNFNKHSTTKVVYNGEIIFEGELS